MERYLFKIGKQEYNCYDETVNRLADMCDGVLSKEQLIYAIQQLQTQMRENFYIHSIDTFGLILDFCNKQGVEKAIVVEKGNAW